MERWQQPRHIGWSNWDNVLERDESGEPGDWCAPPVDGWAASDAGFTARHGNTNRTIMVFGDSAMGNPPSFSPNKANTILVFPSSPSYTPPSLTNFYARTGTGNWGSVANCKNYASGVTKPWMPEFSGDLGPSGNHWWWPGQAIVPAGSDTLHMFWYPVRCTNGEAFGNCDPPLDYHYTKDQKVCTIANINGSAINWATPTCSALSYVDGGVTKSPLDIGIIRGTGLMQEGSDIYVFGSTIDDGYTSSFKWRDVVVAKTTAANLPNYTSWEFLKVSGAHGAYSTGVPTARSQLHIVAHDAADSFTVDKITINNKTRYVMVQRYFQNSIGEDLIAVRTAKSGYKEWYDLPTNMVSDQHTWIANVDQSYGIDPPCGSDEGHLIYHMRGQWDLSDQSSNKMMLSYYCGFVAHNEVSGNEGVSPWDLNGNGSCVDDQGDPMAYWRGGYPWMGSLVGRIRFYNLDLMRLDPWCTSNCWTP